MTESLKNIFEIKKVKRKIKKNADLNEWCFLNSYNKVSNLFTKSKNVHDFDIIKYESTIIG